MLVIQLTFFFNPGLYLSMMLKLSCMFNYFLRLTYYVQCFYVHPELIIKKLIKSGLLKTLWAIGGLFGLCTCMWILGLNAVLYTYTFMKQTTTFRNYKLHVFANNT